MYERLNKAVLAICRDNRRLIGHIGRIWDFLVQGAEYPNGETKLSVALRCEQNGAHRLLEAFNSAVKGIGRDNLPRCAIKSWVALSSRRLLDELLSVAANLSPDLDAQSDQLRHAVNAAMAKEDALTNFLLGESGAGENLTEAKYRERLDKFVRDLKLCFGGIATAVEDIEVAVMRKHRRGVKRKAKAATRHATCASKAVAKTLQIDLQNIRKEVRRRQSALAARQTKTSIKRELKRLFGDPAWSRRCRQWRFETLYTYVVRHP